MKHLSRAKVFLLGNLVISASLVCAQEYPAEELLPGLRERAVVMDIAARVMEQNQEIVWDSEDSRVTIPGRPVGLRLVGTNIAVTVQFTPYFTRGRNVLVAQGQIWVNIPNKGVSYHTIMQTIPLEFEEAVFFFPLGSAVSQDDASIEIQVTVHPYLRETVPVETINAEEQVP